MFESLFQYPTVVARHRQGPAADERERFLLHRAKEGATRGTLLQIARELLVIVKYISVTTDKAIGRHDLEVAADRWARRQQRKHRSHGPRWSRELFLHVGTHWLRFLGRWQKPEPAPPLSFAARIQDFVSHMREERGLSEVTIRGRCWHVQKFLTWLISQNRRLAEASVGDVDAFLSGKGDQDWGGSR